MKNAAARVFYPVLIALLSTSISIGGWRRLQQWLEAAPEITAATKLVPADLLKEVSAFLLCGGPALPDLPAPCAFKGLADLALGLGPGGEEAVNCLLCYLMGNSSDPVIKARAKAVGTKRGVTPELFSTHACNLQMRGPLAPTGQHQWHLVEARPRRKPAGTPRARHLLTPPVTSPAARRR